MEDLISYSFQVARGMEFLSSRKVSLTIFTVLLLHQARSCGRSHGQTHTCAINPLLLVFACMCVLKCRVNFTTHDLIYPDMRKFEYSDSWVPAGRTQFQGKSSLGFRLDEPGTCAPQRPLACFQSWPDSQTTRLHGRASINTSQWGPPRKLQLDRDLISAAQDKRFWGSCAPWENPMASSVSPMLSCNTVAKGIRDPS